MTFKSEGQQCSWRRVTVTPLEILVPLQAPVFVFVTVLARNPLFG
jgi:hypothetical protein